MNVLIVSFSKFGHTRKIAVEIAKTLQEQTSVREIAADQLRAADFSGLDLLIFGTPTHRMNLPEAMRPILEDLPRRCLRGVKFAAFDTSYKMSPWLEPFTESTRAFASRALSWTGANVSLTRSSVLPPCETAASSKWSSS